MVGYLERIINLEVTNSNAVVMASTKNLALSAQALADKTASLMQRNRISPTMWQSLNYTQGEELLNNPNYGKYVLAEKIFGMTY